MYNIKDTNPDPECYHLPTTFLHNITFNNSPEGHLLTNRNTTLMKEAHSANQLPESHSQSH